MSDDKQILLALYEQFTREAFTGIIPHHKNLVIDASPLPLAFIDAAYPFQWDRLKRISPAIEMACGLKTDYDGPTAFWEVARRGMDKTSGLARIMNWILAFSPRPIEAIAAAADGKQVGFLISAMKKDAELNPWIGNRIRFIGTDERAKVTGAGGTLNVQPANSKGAWGGRQDLIILDEVVWWSDEGRKLWEAVISARSKRPRQVTLIISNAGILDSWQHEAFELIKTFPDWEVFEFPANVKTWMNREQIERERKLLTPGTAKRVFDNIWIPASEDSGYLTPEEIEEAYKLGHRLQLRQRTQGEPGKQYVAVVDYGAVKDRTALWVGHLEVLHPSIDPVLITDSLDVWVGTHDNPVKLERVKDWIKRVNISFNRPTIIVDQHQMEGIVQELQSFIKIKRFRFRGGQANFEMAELLKSLFVDNRIAIYEGAGKILGAKNQDLKSELKGLVIERKTGLTYRFDHTKTKHDDGCVAMGMGAMELFSNPLFTPMGKLPRIEKKTNHPGGLDSLAKISGIKKLKIWGQ